MTRVARYLRTSLDEARRRPVASLAVLGLLVVLFATLIWPILLAVRSAFVHEGQVSWFWFGRALEDAQTWRQLGNGIALACVTTLLCLAISLPLAVLRSQVRFRGQGVLGVAVLLPLILPPFVGAMAMRRILGRFGVLNILLNHLGLVDFAGADLPPNWLEGGLWPVAIVQALHLFPILYLNASAALANIDPAHLQASRNLGAGPWRTFWTVTLPLMRPGLFAGGTIVFIWSFTDLGTPLMLEFTDLLPVQIFREISGADYAGRTFALVVILLAISVLLYVLGKFVFGRVEASAGGKATIQSDTRPLGVLGTVGAWVLFGGVIVLAILPHVGVVLQAITQTWIGTVLPTDVTGAHMVEVLRSDETYSSIQNSLRYAGASVVFDLLLGTLAAWLIVRSKAPGRGLLDAIVMLPLAVPGLIIATGYVALTAPGSALESFGPAQTHGWVILILAYTVRRLPLVVRGVGAGLQQVPVSLEEAARNLGSGRVGAATRVTLPLIAANLIAAGVLAFSFAVLEVSDSLLLAQTPEAYPITKQIYELFSSGTLESIYVSAALGLYGMALLAGTMLIASALLGKRLGAVFRA